MNVLTLSIKQKHFDEIVAGTKKKEYREVRPTNFKKFGRLVVPFPGGKEYESWDNVPENLRDADWGITPVKYDALKLLTGEYKGKRPFIMVEVVESDIYLLTDENGNDIVIGEGTDNEYLAAEICYELGNIIEKSF